MTEHESTQKSLLPLIRSLFSPIDFPDSANLFPCFNHMAFSQTARKSWDSEAISRPGTPKKTENSLLFHCLTGNFGGYRLGMDWNHSQSGFELLGSAFSVSPIQIWLLCVGQGHFRLV